MSNFRIGDRVTTPALRWGGHVGTITEIHEDAEYPITVNYEGLVAVAREQDVTLVERPDNAIIRWLTR
jgi:preprotein translocase subunit YajC